MKLKPVSSLHSVTTGELLAMCKLVQMVSNAHEFEVINTVLWEEYVKTSLGLEKEGADALCNRSRQLSNRILAKYATD